MNIDMIDLNLILVSFGGGIFGATIGPIVAFIFCGVLIMAGVAGELAGNPEIVANIAFGPYFGPHISFGAAVVAAAYAGKKGLVHGCSGILTPLFKFKKYDVLLVGGIAGVLGYLINSLLAGNLPVDTIALTIAILHISARFIFGKSGLFGSPSEGKRTIINPSNLPFNMLLGFSVGLISSYATQITGSAVIGFGISAVTLIFLYQDEFPCTHHVAIIAAYAYIATGSILVGGLFGILAILLGEVITNLLNSTADTYIDYPAAVIATLSTIIFVFM